MNEPSQQSYGKYSTKVNFSYPKGQSSFQFGRLGIEDSYLTGTLRLHFNKLFVNQIILKFIGTEHVYWTETRTRSISDGCHTETYSATNILCCLSTCLLDNSDKSYQEISNMDLPFKIKLPENIASTLRLGIGNVNYKLTAEISRKRNFWKFQGSRKNIKCDCNILKYCLLPPPVPVHWVEYDTEKAITSNGIGYNIHMDDINFGPSNPIIVYVKLKLYNPKLKIKEMFVGLKKYSSFSAQGSSKHENEYVLKKQVIGDKITWDNYNECQYTFVLDIPEDMEKFGQTIKLEHILIAHKVEIKIKKEGMDIDLEHDVRIDNFLSVTS
nr:4381_t:CDS:1 [Entrophospora candida]